MPPAVWQFSTSNLSALVDHDTQGQPAWDGGQYVYVYGQGDPGNGFFARYDIDADDWTELTPIPGNVGAGVSEVRLASGSTSVSVAEPTRLRTGDLELILVESTDSTTAAGTPNTPSGWTKLFEETQADTAAGVTTLTIFAKIGTDGEGSVTIDGVGDHLTVIRVLIQDHGVTDVSTDIIIGTGNGADTGNGTMLGITTAVDNTFVVMVAVSTRDSSSGTLSGWANANLLGVHENQETGTTTGAGGRVAIASGIKATAGATGDSTVSIAVSDKWRSVHLGIPPASGLGVGRNFHSSAVRGGKVYLFAGAEFINGVSNMVPTTNIYDIVGDSWDADGADMKGHGVGTALAVPGEFRSHAAAVAIADDIVYVIAGFGSGDNAFLDNRADKYDPDTDTWTALTDMASGTDMPSLTVDSDNIIHSMGGGSSEDFNAHLALDPSTDTWITTLADIPNPDIGHGLAVLARQCLSLYDPTTGEIVVSVLQNSEALGWDGLTARYNVGTDTWSADITEDLSEASSGGEGLPDIIILNQSIGWARGLRRSYQTTQFRLSFGTGIVFYDLAPPVLGSAASVFDLGVSSQKGWRAVPAVHFEVDDVPVDVDEDWALRLSAYGGYLNGDFRFPGYQMRRRPSAFEAGAPVKAYTQNGFQVWEGTVAHDPHVDDGGMVGIETNGPWVDAVSADEVLPFQIRGGGMFADGDSDPYNYPQNDGYTMAAHRGKLQWKAPKGEDFVAGQVASQVIWIPGASWTRFAFILNKNRDDAEFSVRVRGGTGPSGTLTTIGTYSLGGGGPASGSEVEDASLGDDYDLLSFQLLCDTDQPALAERLRVWLTSIRLNDLAVGDDMTASEVITYVGDRLGWNTDAVGSTGVNVLPLLWQESWAELLLYMADLEDQYVRRVAGGLQSGDWGEQDWEILRSFSGTPDLRELDVFNRFVVKYETQSGKPAQVVIDADPDPIPDETRVMDYDLADPQPNNDLATSVGELLMPRFSRLRHAGKIPVYKARHEAGPLAILPGDTGNVLDWDMGISQSLRIQEIEQRSDHVDLAIESPVSLVRLMAEARRGLGHPRRRGKNRSLHGARP